MGRLRCIAYFSSATKVFTEAELEALLISARDFNKKHGITGVLLYVNDSFMQYFEGAEADVGKVYKRITDSRQHKEIIKVLDQSIDVRSFPDWLMGLSRPVKSELLKFHAISWMENMNGKNDSLGMRLLKRFWDRRGRFGY
ncbi:MAG: BLUF domain-containing protein [Methylococcaceae bacterium]|nr:BLUF domain-containing protein [Methylococcaceae bacterium]